jgi:predicted MFS family arabinose efflux permease
MAANFYHAEPTKMPDYGYGTDHLDERDPYSFGGYAAAAAPPNAPGVDTQRTQEELPKKKSVADGIMSTCRGQFERCCTDVNYELLVSKTFYFFFYAAFGSLFPLIGIYFKQLGMNPAQAGMLIGFRPFIELLAGPFWGNVAERWKKWKTILLFSLFCWVAFTLSLAFVQPAAHSCLVGNKTYVVLAEVNSLTDDTYLEWTGKRTKRALLQTEPDDEQSATATGGNQGAAVAAARMDIYRRAQWAPVGRVRRSEDESPVEFKAKVYFSPATAGVGKGRGGGGGSVGGGRDNEKAPAAAGAGKSKVSAAADDDDGEDDGDDDNDDDDNSNNPEAESPRAEAVGADGTKSGDVKKPIKMGHTFEMLPHPRIDKLGMSPLPLSHVDIANLYDEKMAAGLVSPPHSAVVYRLHDIHTVFLALLLLQIVGEFLSTPAITMADTATLGYLNNDAEGYGRQRMFGSMGWAIAMFFVGIALDYSNVFPNHPCGTVHVVDRNYMTCYAVFAVLMCCAFLTATQFRFKEADTTFQNIQLSDIKNRVVDTLTKRGPPVDRQNLVNDPYNTAGTGATAGVEQPKLRITLRGDDQGAGGQQQQQQQPRPAASGDMISDAAAPLTPGGGHGGSGAASTGPCPYVPRGVPGQAGNLPQWVTVLRMFAPIRYSSMLFVLWFMGFGIGLVFAFLFWHLQDIGGTPTLFGFASVINHVSELVAFFYIQRVVYKFGYINVIYAGIVANVIRFMYISYLQSPWWILPFELVQGLTHASVWAAGCAYMTQAVPVENRPTAQMILQSLHHAFGRGCGVVIGGAIINSYGTQGTFLAYAVMCIFVFVGYLALNFFYIRKLPLTDVHPEPVAPESVYLAPHGVPGGLSHSSSNSRMEKDKNFGGDAQYYGSNTGPSSTNGYLDSGSSPYARPDNSYNPNMYRGGGGVPRDSDYGYSNDFTCPTIGQFKLGAAPTPPKGTNQSGQNNKSHNDVTDVGVLRRKFQAYDEATTQETAAADAATTSSKSLTRRLIMNLAPRPTTQTVAEQPFNRDRMAFEEQSPDGWLY